GDNAAPLVVITLTSSSAAALQKCSGSDAGLSTIHAFSWSPGSSITTRIRLKTSTSSSGSVQVALNGGSLSGSTGIAMFRPSATTYHPKWGLYRGLDSSEPFGNDYTQHSSCSSN